MTRYKDVIIKTCNFTNTGAENIECLTFAGKQSQNCLSNSCEKYRHRRCQITLEVTTDVYISFQFTIPYTGEETQANKVKTKWI